MTFFLLCRVLLPPLARGNSSSLLLLWNEDYLFVRDQLPDVSLFSCRNHRTAAQLPLAFLALRRKQVSLETFIAFDLSAGRNSKPLGRGPVSLDFGHINLLFSLVRIFT
jgi:hypothetical protein